MRRVFWVCVFLFLPVLAEAQAITALRVTFYRTGASAPAVAPFDIPLSVFQCGRPRVADPTGTVINPTAYMIDDPADEALPQAQRRQCLYVEPPGGALTMLPFDTEAAYTARSRYINSVDIGQEGPDSNPFSRPGSAPTVTPAGLRIVRVGS